MKIGVFDSGVGGLTVLRWLVRRLPDAEYVYFGDTARVPYGNRSTETIVEYVAQGLGFLERQGADLLVVACNTASALALPLLRPMLRVPALGVIEAGIDAAIASSNGTVLVLGTRATVESNIYQQGIVERAPSLRAIGCSCPLLVALAEEGWANTSVATDAVSLYLEPYRSAAPDTVLLGCTHFPVLEAAISARADWSPSIVDPGYLVAERAAEMLGVSGSSGGSDVATRGNVYVTDSPASFERVARLMNLATGWDIDHVSLTSLVGH
jgi:glutamate racemase